MEELGLRGCHKPRVMVWGSMAFIGPATCNTCADRLWKPPQQVLEHPLGSMCLP